MSRTPSLFEDIMRSDMAKVVTERPRRGSRNASLKTARRLTRDEITQAMHEDDDFGPARAPVSRRRQHGWDAKEFTDVLNPLRGYLRKQVGRPWDKVWSELSANLDKRSITGQHIFDHIKWEIETHAIMVGNRAHKHWGGGSYWTTLEVDGLYVHPRTGLVCHQEARPTHGQLDRFYGRRRAEIHKLKRFGVEIPWDNSSEQRLADHYIETPYLLWERRNGLWYAHTYVDRDPNEVIRVDEIIGKKIARTRAALKMPLFERVSTRSANKKDIKRITKALESR